MEGGDVRRRGVVIVQSQWRARKEGGRGEAGVVVHRSQDTLLPSRRSHVRTGTGPSSLTP